MSNNAVIATSYYGSKRQHLKFILPLLPQTKIYVEPFGGSAAVLLNRMRSEVEVYNDLFVDLCALMVSLRDHLPELQNVLRFTPYSRKEVILANANADIDMEKARRLLIKTYQSMFSKLIHNNTTGTDWGRQVKADFFGSGRRHLIRITPWVRLPVKHEAASRRLQGVIVENRDALDVIKEYDSPDTLFYLDPPYVLSTRVRKDAYMNELKDSAHDKLADLLLSVKGKVAVSGYKSDLYDDLFPKEKGWVRYDDASKLLSASNMKGASRTESLWCNYKHSL